MTPPRMQRKTNPPTRFTPSPFSPSRWQRKKKSANSLAAMEPKVQSGELATVAKKSKLEANPGMRKSAKIVVGIDFGTTFSGFAYCSSDDPEEVFTFYEWPSQQVGGAKSYCKTQTCLWYVPGKSVGTFELQDWGWPAYLSHCKALQDQKKAKLPANNFNLGERSVSLRTSGHFFKEFKLHLPYAGSNDASQCCTLEVQKGLPEGFSVERLITDYLKQLSVFIMKEVNHKFGKSGGKAILKKDVEWLLTVPSISTDAAKNTMLECAEMAGLGLVPGHSRRCQDEDASLQVIQLVLEPEAASVYCLRKLKNSHDFRKGSKHLLVDAGGGTVDLVAHQKWSDSGLRLKELTRSTGGLCGSTFVDNTFKSYLGRRIGCFRKFSEEHPVTVLTILGSWQSLKHGFDDHEQDSFDVLEIPHNLGKAWEAHDKRTGSWNADPQYYEQLVITNKDMKKIFDGQVDKILRLIREQLDMVPGIEGIMVVGGFACSPYLKRKIREIFSDSVKYITSPGIDPGSAVCQGAVAFGSVHGADIMMSRKSRKTYGVRIFRPFRKGDPSGSNVNSLDGNALCRNVFDVLTRIGDDIPVNHCVRQEYVPFSKKEKFIKFTMYSTSDPKPAFVTDAGVEKVGSWSYPIPLEAQKMKDDPSVEIAMYFGRTHIEMSAQPKNFGGGKKPMFKIAFDKELRDDVLPESKLESPDLECQSDSETGSETGSETDLETDSETEEDSPSS